MKETRKLRFVTSPILFLLEYFFKVSAGLLTVIVLGGQGSYFGKIGEGLGSLVDVFYKIIDWPERILYFGKVIDDYNSLTASSFNQRYGGQAIGQVMEILNEAVNYVQLVYRNVTEQPFTTILASLTVFLFFYICGRLCRFIRQRGRGSYLIQKERELGSRVFDR